MKLSCLLKGSDVAIGDLDLEINGISDDSREVKKGYAFFAIKGEKTDGNIFIANAIKNGASVIISQKDYTGNYNDIVFLKTSDILRTFSIASKNFYNNPSSLLSVIGITGTKGKTTTSYITEKILGFCGKKTGVIGTINYRTHKRIISDSKNTTPLADELNRILVEMVKDGDEMVVMEVSSHSLKLKRVFDVEFNRAVFTNLQSDHLDFHKTIDDYINSKLLLFELLNASPKGDRIAILNIDDPISDRILKVIRTGVITYAIKKSADVIAKDIDLKSDSLSFNLVYKGRNYKIVSNLIGIYNVYNILSAISISLSYNIDIEKIIEGVRKIDFIPGRLEKIEANGFYIYIDYAHTEESLKQVLLTLNSIKRRKIITVFGCGGDRDKTKRPLMGKVASELSDFVIITSDNPRTEDPSAIIADILSGMVNGKKNYKVVSDRRVAIKEAIRYAKKGDIILVAGKGHENYQIIGGEKIYFSDREEVLKALKEIK